MFFNEFLMFLSTVVTLGCAFAVAYTSNLMHACIYLLASFFGIAGLYATLGADFLAATQIVVYAGGVVTLMLFAVMLTGGASEKINKFGLTKIKAMGNKFTFAAAIASGLVIALVLLKILASILKSSSTATLPPYEGTVEKIGTLLITDHVLAFEISSILLLGALIGAAVISRPRKEKHD